MTFSKTNLWYLGAHFMANIQARDRASARRNLDLILRMIERESDGRFGYFKLRTLQVLTNANRAAFNAGASTELLNTHSLEIVREIDEVQSAPPLLRIAHGAVDKTIGLVPVANEYRDRIVQEAIAHIRDHFAEDMTRETIGQKLGCSPTHFSRIFSQSTGYTFRDFLIQCRLEKAKELLRNSHLHIREIAEQVGYDDPFQFSKLFRNRLGMSPRQFREARLSAG
ncbi:MAG: transcriptional regulator, AraC family [Verrucomicrobia bacterium]|nr:transcriptional regulator, AraC family [Verrucomicrobiota bacterium]